MFTQAILDSHSYNMWKWHTGKSHCPKCFPFFLARPFPFSPHHTKGASKEGK